jgi:YD repeat-containing protein
MKNNASWTCLVLPALALAGVMALSGVAGTINYTYDPAGRLTSASFAADTNISYAYDPAGNLLAESEPAPGIILAAVTGKQLTFWWAAAPAGYGLQSSPALGPGEDWQDITAPKPLQTGNLLTLTVTVGPDNTFYRLVSK